MYMYTQMYMYMYVCVCTISLVLVPILPQTRLDNTGIVLGELFHLRLDQRPQSFLPASFYPSSSHFSRAPPPYSSLSGVQESTSHPLSMPVLVSGKEPVSQNRFVGVEVNHNSRVYHEKAGCSSSSGGVAVGGVVNMDTSAVGRSSTFTTTQEVEVRGGGY